MFNKREYLYIFLKTDTTQRWGYMDVCTKKSKDIHVGSWYFHLSSSSCGAIEQSYRYLVSEIHPHYEYNNILWKELLLEQWKGQHEASYSTKIKKKKCRKVWFFSVKWCLTVMAKPALHNISPTFIWEGCQATYTTWGSIKLLFSSLYTSSNQEGWWWCGGGGIQMMDCTPHPS